MKNVIKLIFRHSKLLKKKTRIKKIMIDDHITRLKEKELLTPPEISYVCDLVRPIF